MADKPVAANPAPSAPADAETTEPYARSYGILFQTWLVLFLVVICFALLNYLAMYLPR